MQTVPRADLEALRSWFTPEQPGPLIFEHVMNTGIGTVRVDRLRDPRVVLAESTGNYALRGDPAALTAGKIKGLVQAPPEWLPTLQTLAPDVASWDRIIAVLPAAAAAPPVAAGIRRLGPGDAGALEALGEDIDWIHESWGGPAGLAAAAVAFGAFAGAGLASVAVPFFVGNEHEDIGVVTAAGSRRKGLSTACSSAVIGDIRARGHQPSWTTSPDNAGSLGVARRLGFVEQRRDLLYAVGVPIPVPE